MAAPLTGFINDGLSFDVRDSGPADGPVVIALHGFPQTSASWDAVTPHLSAAGCRVLAPDQRGYSPGARPSAVAAYRIDRLAADVLALADAAGADRFHVLGHDWGGAVAWHLGAAHPDRVTSVTVASTPHPQALTAAMRHGQWRRSWYMGFFQLPWLPEWVLRTRDGAITRALFGRMRIPDEEAVLRFLSDPRSARAAINWYRAAFRPGAVPTGRISVPTTYVWSDQDPALGRWAAEATAEWVDADYRFVVLDGVSHWIPDEQPGELARLALQRIGGPGLNQR